MNLVSHCISKFINLFYFCSKLLCLYSHIHTLISCLRSNLSTRWRPHGQPGRVQRSRGSLHQNGPAPFCHHFPDSPFRTPSIFIKNMSVFFMNLVLGFDALVFLRMDKNIWGLLLGFRGQIKIVWVWEFWTALIKQVSSQENVWTWAATRSGKRMLKHWLRIVLIGPEYIYSFLIQTEIHFLRIYT